MMNEMRVPPAVWVLETNEMGVLGVFSSEAEAKRDAESNWARAPLEWRPIWGSTIAGLDAAGTEGYFVTVFGVRSSADEPDPLNDGSARATEPRQPLTNTEKELAARLYPILGHTASHGIGDYRDCPACEGTPNPFDEESNT